MRTVVRRAAYAAATVAVLIVALELGAWWDGVVSAAPRPLTHHQRILVRDLRTHYAIGQVGRQVGQLQNALHLERTDVYANSTRAASFGALKRWDLSGAWPPRPGVIRYDYAADIRTTETGDWSCIRQLEEGGATAPANEYGFVPYSWGMSARAQSALAMSILRAYGWGAWTTAPACGL
jgi:hypothetical protein